MQNASLKIGYESPLCGRSAGGLRAITRQLQPQQDQQ